MDRLKEALFDRGAANTLSGSPREVEELIHKTITPNEPIPPRAWWERIGRWVAFEERVFRESGASSLEESPLPMPRSARMRACRNQMMSMVYGPLALVSFMMWTNVFSTGLLIGVTIGLSFRAHKYFREDVNEPSLMWWDMLRLFWLITIVLFCVEGVAYRSWERDERRWCAQEFVKKAVERAYQDSLEQYKSRLRRALDCQWNTFGHLRRAFDTTSSQNGTLFELIPAMRSVLKPYEAWAGEYEKCLNVVINDAWRQFSALNEKVDEVLRLYEAGADESDISNAVQNVVGTLEGFESVLERLEQYGTAYWLPGLPPMPRLKIEVLPPNVRKIDPMSN